MLDTQQEREKDKKLKFHKPLQLFCFTLHRHSNKTEPEKRYTVATSANSRYKATAPPILESSAKYLNECKHTQNKHNKP
jgi:hypothetical protein